MSLSTTIVKRLKVLYTKNAGCPKRLVTLLKREVMTYEQRSSYTIDNLARNSFNNRRITALVTKNGKN